MHESCSASKKFLNVVWTSVCTIMTITAFIWQLIKYFHNDDLTAVSFKRFNQDEIDVYPSIGLCFQNVLIEENLGITFNILIPPTDFKLDSPPGIVVTSPRDRIDFSASKLISCLMSGCNK